MKKPRRCSGSWTASLTATATSVAAHQDPEGNPRQDQAGAGARPVASAAEAICATAGDSEAETARGALSCPDDRPHPAYRRDFAGSLGRGVAQRVCSNLRNYVANSDSMGIAVARFSIGGEPAPLSGDLPHCLPEFGIRRPDERKSHSLASSGVVSAFLGRQSHR
jgi:hypothetical protein